MAWMRANNVKGGRQTDAEVDGENGLFPLLCSPPFRFRIVVGTDETRVLGMLNIEHLVRLVYKCYSICYSIYSMK